MSNEQSDVCQELQPRLAAYALGELPADPDINAHLAVCGQCRAALRSYAQIARVLPYAAPEIQPSPALRNRVLAIANNDPAPTERSRQQATRPRRRINFALSAFVLMSAAILGLIVWNVSLQQQLQQRNRLLAASRERWVTVTQILNAPDVQAYALAGNGPIGRLWVTPQGRDGCLVAQALPDPGTDKVYQIWLTQGSTSISGGTFEPVGSDAWTIVSVDRPIASFTTMRITVEPRGGSTAPTGPDVLRGTLDVATMPSPAERVAALNIAR